MKKIFNKINNLWLSFRKWSDVNIFGYIISAIVKLILIIVFAVLLYLAFQSIWPNNEDSSLSDSSNEQNDCNVIGINLHGELKTYLPNHAENDSFFNYDSVSSEDITGKIKLANEDSNIKTIIIEVDSPGGSMVGGEEIDKAVKNSEKPVIALIRDIGASASLLSISSADRIYASENSTIGSIGVTMSYLSNEEKNKKDGYTYQQLSSGKFKDSGSPDKELTKEEKALMLRDIDISFNNFVKAISQNRNIPIDKVRQNADGSTFLGAQAKQIGLIDEIGGLLEIQKYLEQEIKESPEICW
ncbi:MAG: signal peptide peptidase SppA [Patescibacteria group bacterium]|jgi:protease-4